MSKRLEKILSQIPVEDNLSKNTAIILKKMMEGLMEIVESGSDEDMLAPIEVIKSVTLAGAALVSDIADKSGEEDAQYTMLSEYAKQSYDSSMFMLFLDLTSVIGKLDNIIEKMEGPKNRHKRK